MGKPGPSPRSRDIAGIAEIYFNSRFIAYSVATAFLSGHWLIELASDAGDLGR